MKVISNVTYRIQCEEVAPTRERRQTTMIAHFNSLKPYLPRPAQLRPKLHVVEGVVGLPVDLNVREDVVMESPTARDIDALPARNTWSRVSEVGHFCNAVVVVIPLPLHH